MDLQIRVSNERIEFGNPGGLSEGLMLEEIRQAVHRFARWNPLLAQGFDAAELIEMWGTGTTWMIRHCRAQGRPDPELQVDVTTFQVIFIKDAPSHGPL